MVPLKLDEPKMAQDWPHGDQEGPEMTQDKAKMAQGWPPMAAQRAQDEPS